MTTTTTLPRLILASGSPRRRDMLERIVPIFDVVASGAEESGEEQLYREFPVPKLPEPFRVAADGNPTLWAWRKALSVARSVAPQAGRDTLVLGADTIVVLDDRILGKPRDAADAAAMLQDLSGREHVVITGWALMLARAGADPALLRYGYASSAVQMRAYDWDTITAYVQTGEPLDKAGAYAVQGRGGRLVAHAQGCWNNVVGLPLCAIRAALLEIGYPVSPYRDWSTPCAGPYCQTS